VIRAAISAPIPSVRGASWTITARPASRTRSTIVSTSSGTSERRSIAQHRTPSRSSMSAASSVTATIAP
jgi:hypothetical protein